MKLLVDQTYSGLLGLQPAASYQPTLSTQRTALDAVLADLRFLVAILASVPPADDAPAANAASAAALRKGEKGGRAQAAQCYTTEEAAALLDFDESLLQRLLRSSSATELTASLHATVFEMADPGGAYDSRPVTRGFGGRGVQALHMFRDSVE